MSAATGTVTVRTVDPADVDRLGRVLAEAYVAGEVIGPDDRYVRDLRDVAGRLPHVVAVLAAYDGAEVLGGLTLVEAGTPEAEVAVVGELEVRMLAVAPQHQGRKVSLALLAAAEELGRARGDDALVLSSLPAMSAAHRVYQRYGFDRVVERDWAADWDPQALADGTAPTLSVYRLPLKESS
ncbi:GNAT family N-acetyltransferase [Georgenia satyanarayanai]|uniref:GNAT family N-acetyltransferase n=1 Tax=Georgenia satyanarayanai TaxID=860221 RepID=UPI00203F3074|nr:GNAT family N-acetyltransferase [Georgenia satyanarayanai]MCM3662458.1 GNAT family N-acetyltransferase [Georgenia satyanarayanai]